MINCDNFTFNGLSLWRFVCWWTIVSGAHIRKLNAKKIFLAINARLFSTYLIKYYAVILRKICINIKHIYCCLDFVAHKFSIAVTYSTEEIFLPKLGIELTMLQNAWPVYNSAPHYTILRLSTNSLCYQCDSLLFSGVSHCRIYFFWGRFHCWRLSSGSFILT